MRASSKRRSPARWASGSAGQRNTRTSSRSGPTLGDGPAPQIADLVRAVRLSRAVQLRERGAGDGGGQRRLP